MLWNFEICTISIFWKDFVIFLASVDDTPWWKKHLGLIKMANILQITFSNGSSFKKMLWLKFYNIFLAATKQLYWWFSPSVCLSVCLSVSHSVCLPVTPFSLCALRGITMNFSGQEWLPMTEVMYMQNAKGQGQRLKVKLTEVKSQLCRFRTITLVWFHIWWWCLIDFQGHLSNFKVTQLEKIIDFDPN